MSLSGPDLAEGIVNSRRIFAAFLHSAGRPGGQRGRRGRRRGGRAVNEGDGGGGGEGGLGIAPRAEQKEEEKTKEFSFFPNHRRVFRPSLSLSSRASRFSISASWRCTVSFGEGLESAKRRAGAGERLA